jgi:hypothetical protein
VTALRTLERFLRARRSGDAGRCDLCAELVAERHRHAVDVIERRLVCICSACTILLVGSERGRYRAVPDRVRVDPTCALCDSDIGALGVPVTLAFFFRSSWSARRTAVLPSPAGATESEIDDAAWSAFEKLVPIARSVADDVEALLVRRSRVGFWDCLVVPIDVGYEVAGLVRRHWRGIDGGDEARLALDERIAELVTRAELWNAEAVS